MTWSKLNSDFLQKIFCIHQDNLLHTAIRHTFSPVWITIDYFRGERNSLPSKILNIEPLLEKSQRTLLGRLTYILKLVKILAIVSILSAQSLNIGRAPNQPDRDCRTTKHFDYMWFCAKLAYKLPLDSLINVWELLKSLSLISILTLHRNSLTQIDKTTKNPDSLWFLAKDSSYEDLATGKWQQYSCIHKYDIIYIKSLWNSV